MVPRPWRLRLLVGVPKPRPLGSVCEVVPKVGANIGSWASASGMLVGFCIFNWSSDITVVGVGNPEPFSMRVPVTTTFSVDAAPAPWAWAAVASAKTLAVPVRIVLRYLLQCIIVPRIWFCWLLGRAGGR